jgi:hypothetical protein
VSGGCCECCKEEFVFNDFGVGPHAGNNWPTFRGQVAGNFSAGPAAGGVLKGIPHPPWCSVRPSIIIVSASVPAPSDGTLRAIIEGTRDFSTCIWAELKSANPIFQPFTTGEHDHIAGRPALVPRENRRPSNTYVPAFGYGVASATPTGPTGPSGLPTGGLSNLGGGTTTGSTGTSSGPSGPALTTPAMPEFVFRNAEDDDSYFYSKWPVANPRIVHYPGSVEAKEFRACTLSISCGSHLNGVDAVEESFLSLFNASDAPWSGSVVAPGSTVRLRVGAYVEDRLHLPDSVPCGIYVDYGYNHEQSWSWPFTVPKSVIASTNEDQLDTPRYIGLQQTATNGTSLDGEPYRAVLSINQLIALNACDDNSSAVLPALAEEENAFVPVVAWLPTAPALGAEVTEEWPYYARRSDRVLHVRHNVPNGDSWHASHIVREGTFLASKGELHKLDIELLPHDSETPAITQAFFVATYGAGNAGLRLELIDNDPFPWNAISATTYAFLPEIEENQLFPNQWHYWSEQPQRSFTYPIEQPTVNDLAEPTNPAQVTQESLALLNGTAHRAEDYRAAFKYETAVQGFAFTTLKAVPHISPFGISLADSGMASHDWDRIKHNGVYTATPQVQLHCEFRVREKWTVTEVKGYAREWQIATQTVTGPGNEGGGSQLGGGTSTGTTTTVAAFQQTGNMLTVAAASGRDVAITEKQLAFSVDLTQHIGALANGERVELPMMNQGVHQRSLRVQLKKAEV